MASAVEIGDVARVVAYVLPGYTAIELRGLLIRARKRQDLDKLAWSLLLSLASYVLSVGVVWLVLGRRPDWQTRTTASLANWWFVAILFGFGLILGYGAARLTSWEWLQEWLRRHHVAMSQYPSVSNEIWHSDTSAPWVRVTLKDGRVACGAVNAYSIDPDDSARELWLYPVFDASDVTSERPALVPGWSVYIPGDQIAFIEAYHYENAQNGQVPEAAELVAGTASGALPEGARVP